MLDGLCSDTAIAVTDLEPTNGIITVQIGAPHAVFTRYYSRHFRRKIFGDAYYLNTVLNGSRLQAVRYCYLRRSIQSPIEYLPMLPQMLQWRSRRLGGTFCHPLRHLPLKGTIKTHRIRVGSGLSSGRIISFKPIDKMGTACILSQVTQ
jgi:hypothetical protein